MSQFSIGVHVKSADAGAVRAATAALFGAQGFRPLGDEALASVVEDEDRLPDGDDWYGVAVSGDAGAGWVSVYVADWPDSGALARELSRRLNAPALELWVADSRHWGYTLFGGGEVRDRFADDPQAVAETPNEAALYRGDAKTLGQTLGVSGKPLEAALEAARAGAGRLAVGPVDQFTQALGLPFAHAFTGYDEFFEADPDDYADDLEDWPRFRHLAFAPPPGRESLVA